MIQQPDDSFNFPGPFFKILSSLGIIIFTITMMLPASAQNPLAGLKSIGYYKALNTCPDTIWFKNTRNRKLKLLVMQPHRQDTMQKCPAMVWIHGGAWVAGSPESFIPHLRWSAALETVAVSIEYRLVAKPENRPDLANGNSVEDCLSDCADAIKYLRKHADELGIDKNKIIVIGDSAGGHLALCLGTMDLPKNAKADVVINCNGISDMTVEKWIKYIRADHNQLRNAKRMSPANYLDRRDAPILTMNGSNDNVVTPQDAKAFYESCLKAGIDTDFILWPGMRHAFIVTNYTATEDQTDKALTALEAFLLKRNFLNLSK